MATVSATIRSAFRLLGTLSRWQQPDAGDEALALEQLNTLLEEMAGFGGSMPFATAHYGDLTMPLPDETRALRILVTAGAASITLQRRPYDGARVSVVDAGAGFSAANCVVSANGLQIDSGDGPVTLSANGQTRTWLFRADLGNWAGLGALAIGDNLPTPPSLDEPTAALLAWRLSAYPEFAGATAALRARVIAAKTHFAALYRKPGLAVFDRGASNLGGRWRLDDYHGEDS